MKVDNAFDKFIIILAVTLVFYFTLVFFSDLSTFSATLQTLDLQFLPMITGLMVLYYVMSGWKFHLLLRQLNIQGGFFDHLKIFLGGLSLGLTPGGIGTAVKSRILKKKYQRSIPSTLPIIVVERWTELIAIVFLVSVLLLWNSFIESQVVIIIGLFFIFAIWALISTNKSFSYFKRLLDKIKYLQTLSTKIDESRESFKILTQKKDFVKIIGISIFTKLIHLVTVYFVFLTVGINLGFFESGQIYYTSLLIGNLSLIPAGVIVTEAGMLSMLAKNNVEFSLASVTVILIRVISTWIPAVIGTLVYNFFFRK